jgi:serine/threonine protein kinase
MMMSYLKAKKSRHTSTIEKLKSFFLIKKQGWNQAVDMWSIGCTLIEFYTGRQFLPSVRPGSVE